MLHSGAVGQTAVGNKPDFLLLFLLFILLFHFSHRSPEKAGKTWVRSTVRHRHDNILSRVCLVLTDHLFTPLPAAAVVRLPSNRFHVNAA